MSVHHAAFCSETFSRFHTTGLVFSPDLGTTVSSLLAHLSIVACGQFWPSGLVRALSPHPAGRPRECSPAWPRWGHGVTCERSESLCWDRVFLLLGDKVQLPQLPGAECLGTSRVWQNAELHLESCFWNLLQDFGEVAEPFCLLFYTYKIGPRLPVGCCKMKCDAYQECKSYYCQLCISVLSVRSRSLRRRRKGEWLGFARWTSEMAVMTSITPAQGGFPAVWGASICSLLQGICSGAPLERVEGAHFLSSSSAFAPQPPVWPVVSHLPSICLSFQTPLEIREGQPHSPPKVFVDIKANNVGVQVSLWERHGVSYDWE